LKTRISAPSGTDLKSAVSPLIRPNTLTGLWARGSVPVLAGVGPKKMQNAEPMGQ